MPDMSDLNNGQFVRFENGVTYIDIPKYRYDKSSNPFIQKGADREKPYGIARYLDIAMLHQFINADILICGVRSSDFGTLNRRELIERIRESGGLPVIDEDQDYDIEAMAFSPFVGYFTTLPFFDLYHTDPRYAEEIPHPTVDIWLVFDINAYEWVGEGQTNRIGRYKLSSDYDRLASLLAVAVIN